MSHTTAHRTRDGGKLPTCPECGYSPTQRSEDLDDRLADAGYDRPYIEVRYGLDGNAMALLCPVCATVLRRTD